MTIYVGSNKIADVINEVQWGNIEGDITNQEDLNQLVEDKADILSPAFTGTPTAPTAPVGTSNSQIATTEFVANHNPFPSQTNHDNEFLYTDGENVSWKPLELPTIPLLYQHYSQTLLNDIGWLRSDTFSWQSGTVYEAVYNHIENDWTEYWIPGKDATDISNWSTDTYDGITVKYIKASDGHKIAPASEENNIQNMFMHSGGANYFIYDDTNTRFKLPRNPNRRIIKDYHNGNYWFHLFSNGWIEQGGMDTRHGYITINFLRTMANKNYHVQLTESYNTSSGVDNARNDMVILQNADTTTSSIYCYINDTANIGVYWVVKGFAEGYFHDDYEYYYVGGHLKNANTIDINNISEMLNSKLDTDRIQFVSAVPANPQQGVLYLIGE